MIYYKNKTYRPWVNLFSLLRDIFFSIIREMVPKR